MDWITAIGKLTGRCHTSRKVGNHTYLKRVFLNHDKSNNADAVALRLHRTDILTWYPDGTIELCNGGYPTCTTHARMNEFLPRGYCVSGEPLQTQRSNGGMTVLRRWEMRDGLGTVRYETVSECTVDDSATINPDGSIVGGDIEKYRADRREERNAAQRPRNRARYWMNKAREGKPFRGTVQDIMAEENATVRVCKMKCYGIERFFLDAKTEVLDSREGYELLAIPLDRWTKMLALKMACTTTGAVYINTVPAHCENVGLALDWMFDTTDYLGTVGQQA